jgi:hypothetical protein
MVGPRDFHARRKTKKTLSTNPKTIRARKYDASIGGLNAGLNKVKRNKRTARCRARKQLHESPAWNTWSSKEQEEKEEEVLLEIEALYELQTQEVMRQWQGDKSEDESGSQGSEYDEEMELSPSSEKSEADADVESDHEEGSFTDSAEEEPENDGEFGDERDANGQRIVSEDVVASFREIWEKGRETLLETTARFETHGNENESPVLSDEDEADASDSASDLETMTS